MSEWEGRFRKKFGEKYIQSICENSDANLGGIKDFIRQEFASQKAELIGEIAEKMPPEFRIRPKEYSYVQGIQVGRAVYYREVRKILETMLASLTEEKG